MSKTLASRYRSLPRTIPQEASTSAFPASSLPNSVLADALEQEGTDGPILPDLGERLLSRQPGRDASSQLSSLLECSASPVVLPEETRMGLEQHFGYRLSNIKFTQSPAVAQLGELAYARGNEVRFAPGAFSPHTQEGQEILRHEVAHIIQQAKGQVQPEGGMPLNTDANLEASADAMSAETAPLSSGPLQTLSPAAPAQAPAQGILGFGWLYKKLRGRWGGQAAEEDAQRASRQASIQKAKDTFLAPGASVEGLEKLDYKTLAKTVDNMSTMASDFQGVHLNSFKAISFPFLKRFTTYAWAFPSKDIEMNELLYSKNKNLTKSINNYMGSLVDMLHGIRNAYGFSIANLNYTGNHEFGHVINAELIRADQERARKERQRWDWYEYQLEAREIILESMNQDTSLTEEERAKLLADNPLPQKPAGDGPHKAAGSDFWDDWNNDLLASQIIQDSAWQAYQSNTTFQGKMRQQAGIQTGDNPADIEQKVRTAATTKNLRRMHYTSAYGARNPGELYAEAFADYYRTRKKLARGTRRNIRENPLSTAIVQQSMRRWNEARNAGYL